MGFKEVAGTKSYVKYVDCEKGQVLVTGKYIRDIQGKYGVQYEFMAESGEVVVLNKAGSLDYKMEFINEGDKIQVIYDGTVKLTKGAFAGKDAHQFKVLRDDDLSELDEDEGVEGDAGLDEFDDL